jgi:hypothetical protein
MAIHPKTCTHISVNLWDFFRGYPIRGIKMGQ